MYTKLWRASEELQPKDLKGNKLRHFETISQLVSLHIQSGAGYVNIDCFSFLNLIWPCLLLWPLRTAASKSSHSMLLFRNNGPNNTMFGLIVFMFRYALCPTWSIALQVRLIELRNHRSWQRTKKELQENAVSVNRALKPKTAFSCSRSYSSILA